MRSLIIILILFSININASGNEIQKAVDAFYSAYLEVRPTRIPNKEELQKFKPTISVDLQGVLTQAYATQTRYVQAMNGQVPPVIEGDLFTSFSYGTNEFKVLSCSGSGKRASCVVELRRPETNNMLGERVEDKIYLIKDSRGWLVDDIEFSRKSGVMGKEGRHLKELLRLVIENGPRQ